MFVCVCVCVCVHACACLRAHAHVQVRLQSMLSVVESPFSGISLAVGMQ